MNSKTVIVFSTRLISPFPNGLFSDAKPKTFTSEKLADYFWDRIKKNDNLIETILADDYFENPPKDELLSFLHQNEAELKTDINKIDPNLKLEDFFKPKFDWIQKLFSKAKPFALKEELKSKFEPYRNRFKDLSLIKGTKSVDLCERLQNSSNQDPYDLDPKKPRVADKPWLYYRCCYYGLDNNNSDISVYAVWSLKTSSPKQRDGKYQWVEALTDQFLNELNPGAEKLFLILHDDDIKPHTPFEVIIDDKHGNTARHVALFQHESLDEIGSFLLETPKDSSPEVVKSYVEQEIMVARIRKWLCDAFDYIKNDDVNILKEASKYLINLDSEKFKDISEKVNEIAGCTTNTLKQHLDDLKMDLIQLLNQKLREYMIIKKS